MICVIYIHIRVFYLPTLSLALALSRSLSLRCWSMRACMRSCIRPKVACHFGLHVCDARVFYGFVATHARTFAISTVYTSYERAQHKCLHEYGPCARNGRNKNVKMKIICNFVRHAANKKHTI